MKSKHSFLVFCLLIVIVSCSSTVNYSEDFKKQTSGKYLFNADDVIEISYQDNDLVMHWRGIETKPVATDTNEFFVPDLYKKLRFVKHPFTNSRYLSEIPENNPDSLRYDYIKVADTYKTPSEYIADKEFDKALEGLLKIKAQDSVSEFINQYKFNRIGYKYLREKNYDDAIGIFVMNTKLHPQSDNTFDSLADAYVKKGDSLLAYENYKKALEINQTNKKAFKFVNAYESGN
ncbi:tetratricopeptide repeat protein [Winogradskyella litorisediminis]|uniref:Tetratricopeptide repeat protein n=1 Tax=Winogradskyella litorisediminis TaxID=1156618 RepID=A0ABW3N952_9FLAO